MQIDQKNPMHWIWIGAAFVALGLIIYVTVADVGESFGTFVAVLGVGFGAVGLVLMGVQHSRRRG